MSISDRIAQMKTNSESWKDRCSWRAEAEVDFVSTPLKSVNAIHTTLKSSQEEWRKRVQGEDMAKFSRTPIPEEGKGQVIIRKGLSGQVSRPHTFHELSMDQSLSFDDGEPLSGDSEEASRSIEPKRLPIKAILRVSSSSDTKLYTPTPTIKEAISQPMPSLFVTRTVQVSQIDMEFVDLFFVSKSFAGQLADDGDMTASSTTPIKIQSPSVTELPETNLGQTAFKRPVGPKSRPSKLSQNPVRALNQLANVKNEYSEVRVRIPDQEDPSPTRNITPCAKIAGSGSLGFSSTPANPVDENAHLSESALAGLASTHDFSTSKDHLRQVAVTNQAPLTTFQRYLLPYKETAMLLHIKGRRHVQTRLVDPVAASLNSGDCFVLLGSLNDENSFRTPIAWIGRYANIVETNKARDIAAWIVKTKDLGFKGGSSIIQSAHPDGYAVIKEGEELQSSGSAVYAFSSALGATPGCKVNSSGTPEEDAIFETVIQHTTRVYEVMEDRLEPCPDVWGSPLRHSMLSTKKAFVFDFGSEIYLWTGNQISQKIRTAGIDLVQQAYAAPYDYSTCTINPINAMSAVDCPASGHHRPEWTLVAKVPERGESVLFKEKFIDWPEGSRFGGIKAARGNVARNAAGLEPVNTSIEAFSPKVIFSEAFEQPPLPAQLLSLEGRFVGRGGEGALILDGIVRKFRVETGDLQVWLISECSRTLVPTVSHGQFCSDQTYVIRWPFKVIYTGQREVTKTDRKAANVEQCAYFFWHGSTSKITQQGAAALMTIELDEEKGPQIRVVEGKEPPAFCNLFDGRMIIHSGGFLECDASLPYGRACQSNHTRLFYVRGERASESHLIEVPASLNCLRSRGIFLVVAYASGRISKSWLWVGANASDICISAGKHIVERLQTSCPPELGIGELKIRLVKEGDQGSSDIQGCLRSLDSAANETPTLSYSESKSRLVVWQLLFNLGQQLTPTRLGYSLEPDLTAAAAFNLSLNTYPESDSIYSSRLPVPSFPILLSDLETVEQPALFLVLHSSTVYLWHGWWPPASQDDSISTPPSSGSSSLYSSFSIPSGRTNENADTEMPAPPFLRIDQNLVNRSRHLSTPVKMDAISSGGNEFLPSGDIFASPASFTSSPGKSGSAHYRYLTARLAALRTTLAFAKQIGPETKALAVYAGIEPDYFLHLFPPTARNSSAACYHLETGKVMGQTDDVAEILSKLENLRFSLTELQQRPRSQELDTTQLENYLRDEEFETHFRMSRSEFAALPVWKRSNLKRSLDLF